MKNKKNITITVIILIIIIIIYLIFFIKEHYNTNLFNNWIEPKNIDGKIIWIYWDDLNGIENRPAYISLCLQTIIKNTKDFNLIFLNKDNIEDYLPELKEIKINYNLDKLVLAQKVDIYRIMLLYKYGGFYLDTDTILLKSPIDLYNQLDNYDFVGFGCTGDVCFPENAYGYPSNSLLISRKKSLLMRNIFNNILNRLISNIDFKNPKNYHELGKHPIWEELNKLIQNDYVYYHIKSDVGIRDTDGNWVTADRLFSNEKFNFKDEDKLIMIMLYNNMMTDLKKIKKEDILTSDWKINYYIKKALKNS